MKMIVEPTGIEDNYGETHMNMMYPGAGGVGVLVHLYKQPTYLLKQDFFIHFITFQSQAWADEWFEEHGEDYEVLWSFEPEEKS